MSFNPYNLDVPFAKVLLRCVPPPTRRDWYAWVGWCIDADGQTLCTNEIMPTLEVTQRDHYRLVRNTRPGEAGCAVVGRQE